MRRAVPLLVAVVTAAAFVPALRADFVLWDDDLNVTDNPHFRGLSPSHLVWMFTALHGGHYQPLTWMSLAVDHALWGLHPTGYHLTNVLLHAINGALVYLLIRALLARAFGTPSEADTVAAAAGALLFAVHPLRVESVAWVSERRDVLSASFYLLTLLGYLRLQSARETGGRTGPWRAATLACFVCSLLAKAWGITLPVVLLVLDAYPLRRFRGRWRQVLWEKLPYAVLATAAAAAAFAAQHRVEAMRSLAQHDVLARAAQAAYGIFFYLERSLLPFGLSPLYLLEERLDPGRPRYALAMLAVVGVTAILISARRRAPWALGAWACYLAILSPVLGFAQTGPQLVADRYTYLAAIPWSVLLAAGVRRLAAVVGITGMWVATGVATLLLVGLTLHQAAIWRDSRTLWEHVLALDSSNHVAWTNRGWVRQLAGDHPGAEADASEAIRLNPAYTLAYLNRGVARQARGDVAAAIADYDAAIRLDPQSADAYYNRGTARHAEGNLPAAIADYTEAMRLDPEDPRPPNNRGWARQDLGDLTGALADYTHALEIAPAEWAGRVQVEQNLAAVRRRMSR